MRTRIFVSLFILVLAVAMSSTAFAAKLKIVNGDGAGEGFNDPTPAAPVGGNKGKTVGQQRQLAFEYAANIWGSTLPDSCDFQVRVFSRFDPLTCTATSAVWARRVQLQYSRTSQVLPFRPPGMAQRCPTILRASICFLDRRFFQAWIPPRLMLACSTISMPASTAALGYPVV